MFGDEITDQPERVVVAELIREAALERLRDELPHSVAVDIDEMGLREGRREDDPLVDIYAVAVRGARQPEADRAGPPRSAAQADRCPGAAQDRGAAGHAGSTWTCT